MKGLITIVVASQLFAIGAMAQTPPGSSIGSGSQTASAPVNARPQSDVIRILTPVANQKLSGTNSVNVRFEIVDTAASAGTPIFLIQLDGNDPVRTSTMEQTFAGVAPGAHNVTVQLVDADNTPISGSRAIVQFVIAKAADDMRPTTSVGEALNVKPEADSNPPQFTQLGGPQAPPNEIMAMNSPLPSASSALPLISVIGFGVLVGGIASAMKTR